ncbi:DNA polymerase III subunit beta [Caldinitratiruptor microaerophilus]|uniref:Beta sliding clamp n=1 Tax=Caldinitratiruptor microaerophilus TaxID=671077 RepID=A0AA35G9A3_9FIRM|nr:DNA polymerase III subunit beta [Caldinitratiruptor microaerophilus]BDG61896.1 DNA polymerase III subunit beta [Caldinitratiruptor microaerophilus]
MRVRVETRALREALATAGRAVASRASIPVLSSVLLGAHADGLSITGYDLALGITARVRAAEVEREGVGCLPARPLLAMVDRLDAAEVAIDWDEERCVAEITWAGGRYRLSGFSAADYPSLPPPRGGPALRLAVETIRHMIGQTIVAVASGSDKAHLQGVHLRGGSDELLAMSSDQVRVALKLVRGQKPAVPFEVTVPAAACRALLAVLPDEGEVAVYVVEQALVWDTPEVTVVARGMDGRYPDLARVVPTRYGPAFEADRRAFAEALERAAAAADAVDLRLVHGEVQMTAQNDLGTYEESMQADVRLEEGDAFTIRFNPRYLVDGLKALHGERVRQEFIDARQPSRLIDPDDDSYQYVVLPIVVF